MHLDAVHAHVHRNLLGTLHRALEGNALLELLGDRLGNELRIAVGITDLLDLEVDFLLGHLLEVLANLVHILALATDDHARTSAEQRDANTIRITLDHDLRETRVDEALLHVLADLLILDEERAERLLRREPAAAPRAVDRQAKACGVDFLTHYLLSLPSVRTTLQWQRRRAIG